MSYHYENYCPSVNGLSGPETGVYDGPFSMVVNSVLALGGSDMAEVCTIVAHELFLWNFS
ncbi:MAG: hypothetical protein ACLFQU_13220 [Candidatus Kapaibacterium sp.]